MMVALARFLVRFGHMTKALTLLLISPLCLVAQYPGYGVGVQVNRPWSGCQMGQCPSYASQEVPWLASQQLYQGTPWQSGAFPQADLLPGWYTYPEIAGQQQFQGQAGPFQLPLTADCQLQDFRVLPQTSYQHPGRLRLQLQYRCHFQR